VWCRILMPVVQQMGALTSSSVMAVEIEGSTVIVFTGTFASVVVVRRAVGVWYRGEVAWWAGCSDEATSGVGVDAFLLGEVAVIGDVCE
jgi:hypothetical protein